MKYFYTIFFLLIFNSTYAQAEKFHIRITQLSENFYIHTSFKPLGKDTFPSNGLFVVTDNSVLLFDTPWTEEQTEELVDSIQRIFKKHITFCLVSHFHDDRTGGLDILKAIHVKTYSSKATKDLCIKNNEKYADYTFAKDSLFSVDSLNFETYFPGEGHTEDNLVVWFPESKILYGGCIVKSLESKSLGNLKDAHPDQWPLAIENILNKYPEIKYVIPGHYSWGDRKLLTHTFELLKKQ